jgi:hypothetical protein
MPSAYVLTNCTLGSDKEIISRLMEIPLVIQAYQVYGAYDIIVRVASDTVEELQQAVKSDIRRLDNIVSTVILVTKEIYKGAKKKYVRCSSHSYYTKQSSIWEYHIERTISLLLSGSTLSLYSICA